MCLFYMDIALIAFEIGIVWSQTGVTLFIEVLGKLGPELFLRQIGYNLPRTIYSLLQGYSGMVILKTRQILVGKIENSCQKSSERRLH